MASVIPLDEDAERAAMARSVLRRMKKRQNALRRRWHELSREEVEAELLAIGRELVEAAPLFLPRAFDSRGETASSDHAKDPSPNGHYHGAAAHTGLHRVKDPSELLEAQHRRREKPAVRSSENERREALISVGERLLDELDRVLKELWDGKPGSQAWS